ncbi:hypothetical protein BDM02DRAFT_3193915 [Thelephora ganbajun]|uniref:Uncharacterized protein n=1 Tax=Thelephora ganbajun TaxID=370292 RepID=A0ACB6YXU6_THEGA|nr:hypothetical protein BDM02DRAFT_3193915 [Thelephora ganbajun]
MPPYVLNSSSISHCEGCGSRPLQLISPSQVLLDMGSSLCNKWYYCLYVPFLCSNSIWATAIASFRSNIICHAKLHILCDPIVDLLEMGLTDWGGADILADSSVNAICLATVVGECLLSLHEQHGSRICQLENQFHLLVHSVDVLVNWHHEDVMALQHQVSELEDRCACEELDDDKEMLLHHPEGVPSPLSSDEMQLLGLCSNWSELVATPNILDVAEPLFHY